MKNKIFKNAIALTGGISTGKSTVCEILRQNNFTIIDADKIAHILLDENFRQIASLFGEKYVKDGKVLRKELGKIIFSNEENKLKLEALLHPLIEQAIKEESKILEENNKTYFIDIPLFFEKMHYPIPLCVLVYTKKDIQIQRLMKRDNISEEKALLKISNQMDIEKKKDLADFIIDNSEDLKHLEQEVKNFLEEIK
ncbi:MAG: dephospho-CoA kinase [Arcobacter sp.]|nr:dephospho-CoA kinase [Arcobacter sp.]